MSGHCWGPLNRVILSRGCLDAFFFSNWECVCMCAPTACVCSHRAISYVIWQSERDELTTKHTHTRTRASVRQARRSRRVQRTHIGCGFSPLRHWCCVTRIASAKRIAKNSAMAQPGSPLLPLPPHTLSHFFITDVLQPMLCLTQVLSLSVVLYLSWVNR